MATRAREAVEAVCRDIEKSGSHVAARGTLTALNLLSDHALLFGYAASALEEPAYEDSAEAMLDEGIAMLASQPAQPWLYGGFIGLALTVEELGQLSSASDEFHGVGSEDPNEEIDEALLTLLDAPSWREHYDLITGLAGMGTYFAARLPRASAAQGLESVVRHLDRLAEQVPDGTTWHTPARLLPPHQREQAAEGWYNLGVAHGVPGVLPILAQAAAANLAGRPARRLLGGAVRWVLARKRSGGVHESMFPYWVAAEGKSEASRMAWCYGDVGVGATLLWSARLVGNGDWEDEALSILLSCARRTPESTGVKDPGLCHGAAGLAHLFNRVFQATRHETFLEASRYWFAETLRMRQPELGYGGFWAYEPWQQASQEGKPATDSPTRKNSSFLTGSVGVALALLGAITPLPPDWDRRMLLTIPPIAAGHS